MQQFEIAFCGEILPGAELEQVKVAIAQLFKADAALMARLFSGKRMVIKQNLDAAATAKYQAAFQRAGAVLEVRDLNAQASESIAPTPPTPPVQPVQPAPVETQATAVDQPTAAPKGMLHIAPRDEYMAAFSDVEAPDFGIAPVGEDLQPMPADKPAPDLDLSGMSLAPVGCDMGQLPGAQAIVPPDISHLKLEDK